MYADRESGQMSLEMIIGLVILLVLATVVVSLFMNVFGDGVDQNEQIRTEQEISQQCSSLCSSYKNAETTQQTLSAALAYCTKSFTFDANGDGVTTDVAGQSYNSYCEDGTMCFNKQSCERAGEVLDAGRCKELMTDYYELTQEDIESESEAQTRANDAMEEQKGSCDLSDVEGPAGDDDGIDTWYTDYFKE